MTFPLNESYIWKGIEKNLSKVGDSLIDILIRYIGNKTKMLQNINNVVDDNINGVGCVLDLFSGSTVVAQSLSKKYTVYTNDIQKYSYVVSKAVLELDNTFDYKALSIDKIVSSEFFISNNNYLRNIWQKAIEYESQLIAALKDNIEDIKSLEAFKFYYENAPYVNNYSDGNYPNVFEGLAPIYSKENYKKLSINKTSNFYMLFSLNYAMPYFSLNQAVFIDSYRYAIDKLLESKEICETEYYIYLSLLMFLLNNIVTSVGDHYAQPQQFKLSDEKKLKKEISKIIKKKSLDMIECLNSKCEEFKFVNAKTNSNKAFCMNYIDVLNSKSMENVDLIYIDPPYTNAHYSRFYHILETLVNYDYPEIEYFGRYRNDRYQSSFCIKSQAIKEFHTMLSKCAELQKIVVMSYSNTKQCIVSQEELVSVCEEYFDNVRVEEQDYLYRNFGQKPNKVKGKELLIICR